MVTRHKASMRRHSSRCQFANGTVQCRGRRRFGWPCDWTGCRVPSGRPLMPRTDVPFFVAIRIDVRDWTSPSRRHADVRRPARRPSFSAPSTSVRFSTWRPSSDRNAGDHPVAAKQPSFQNGDRPATWVDRIVRPSCENRPTLRSRPNTAGFRRPARRSHLISDGESYIN